MKETHHARRDFLKQSAAFGVIAVTASSLRVSAQQGPLKVGIIYISPISDIGWTKQHSLAKEAVEKTFGSKVQVTALDNINQPQDIERVLRDMVTNGNRLIIGTSFSHGTPLQKVAAANPKVYFEHCSGIKLLPNLGSFEAKYYEGTYLAGVAAGKLSKSGSMGFIGGFPIPDIVGPANAFLLGAQSVNPKMQCRAIFLNSWYDPAKEKDAANTLISQGADVILSMTDTPTGVQVAEEKGAWSVGYASDMAKFGPTKQITSFMLDWSSAYIKAVQDVLDGKWKSEERWLGLKEGVVKMAPYAKSIPKDVVDLANQREQAIKDGKLHPFAGEIKDQDGKVRAAAGKVLPNPDIRSINWFVQGMIGQLPKG